MHNYTSFPTRGIMHQDKETKYIDIKEYVLDCVAADRQWGLVRCYLYDASKDTGAITFDGKVYTADQLRSTIPKIRQLQMRRRASIIKTAAYIFEFYSSTCECLMHDGQFNHIFRCD